MKRLLASGSFLAILNLVAAPIAAATPEQLSQAVQMLTAGQAGQALSFLESNRSAGTATTQELFLLGMAAKESGKLGKAEQYFRLALAQTPNAGRIRLELSEVLFRLGSLDESRDQLTVVRDSGTAPAAVVQNVETLVAQVDQFQANPALTPQNARTPKNWAAYVTAGFTSDNNVNSGPDAATITLFGLPFTLSADARRTPDSAAFIKTGANYRMALSNGATWDSGVNIAITNYFATSAFDTTTVNLTTGFSFKAGEKISFSTPVNFDLVSYIATGGWYSRSLGFAPRVQFAMRDNLQLGLATSISRKQFSADSTRDLTAFSIRPSVSFQPSQADNITASLNYATENSGQAVFSTTVKGLSIGYQRTFADTGMRAGISASYSDTQFEGIQAAYSVARHDVSRSVSANLVYSLPTLEGADITASASFQDNASNLEINTYTKSVFSLSFTKNF